MKLTDKVGGVYKDLTTHWRRPAKGNYVSYKEILNFGVGGMGQQCIMNVIGYLGFTASNTLLGSTLGLKPLHLQYIAMVQTILNLFFFVIRGKIVDNTYTKWGRFRPYIAIMGFPIVILAVTFVFLPFDRMGYTQRLICSFLFGISLSMISPLFTDTYGEMGTVITPDSSERAKVITIQSLLYSFSPTIIGFVVPILSNLTGGYTNIRTYRVIIVPVAVVGLALNMFTAFGCKERFVISKTYEKKVGVIEGCLEIYKNKHWWIRTIPGVIGFLKASYVPIMFWIFIYSVQDMTIYAFISTLTGTAATIAMVLTPYLMTKLGNKKLLLLQNILQIVFIVFMTLSFKMPLIYCAFNYACALLGALPIVYDKVMHSEVKDYQQYISGKRMDFMFGTAGLITTPITLLTGLVIPFIYEYMGLTTNYDVLYDPIMRNNMFSVLCVLSVIGSILTVIPFFFYSMSREKHQNIIRVLRHRAMFDDLDKEGELTAIAIKEGMEDIRAAHTIVNAPVPDMQQLKMKLKEVRTLPASTSEEKKKRAQAVSQARQAIADGKKLLLDQGAVSIFMDELDKYRRPEQIRKVRQAEQLAGLPLDRLSQFDNSVLKQAKGLPSSTKAEKKIRKEDCKRAKKLIRMSKNVRKYYPNGIVVPQLTALDDAAAMPDSNRKEHMARVEAMKAAEKALNIYYKALDAYLDAQKIVRYSEMNETMIPMIESRYEEACAELLRKEEEEAAAEAKKKAEKNLAKQGKGKS